MATPVTFICPRCRKHVYFYATPPPPGSIAFHPDCSKLSHEEWFRNRGLSNLTDINQRNRQTFKQGKVFSLPKQDKEEENTEHEGIKIKARKTFTEGLKRLGEAEQANKAEEARVEREERKQISKGRLLANRKQKEKEEEE